MADDSKSHGVGNEEDTTSEGFVRQLGLLDSTMLVAGSMIGSGVFIVSADIGRLVGSSGWLLVVWAITGLLTVVAALSYGELAAMLPRAGGQYVYLREAYGPLWGFLYGWTLFLVIQTGTIAAVAVAFARFLGVVVPFISPTQWVIPPIILSRNYAISLSTQQVVAILVIALLTILNTRGLRLGKIIQNVFTSVKTLSLLALVVLGLFIGRNGDALRANFANFGRRAVSSRLSPTYDFSPGLATGGALGLLIAVCVAQVGSLFSSDAWNNITFTAGEVKGTAPQPAVVARVWHGLGHCALPAGERGLPLCASSGKNSARGGRPCRHGGDAGDVRRRALGSWRGPS